MQAPFCHTWQVRQKRRLAHFTQSDESPLDLSIHVDSLTEGYCLLAR